MKYYVREHLHGYQQIADTGKSSWDELHGRANFEDAMIRQHLALALPQCVWQRTPLRALEYGCGTGPGACYLAEQGFEVTGIDLDSTAIALARQEATKRNWKIDYVVGDICAWPQSDANGYDLIVDSFCLQSIVTEADRALVLRFVREHLAPGGNYLICSAGFRETRRYDYAHFDPQTGIVYVVADDTAGIADLIEINGTLYMPYRRHLHVAELVKEVAAFDFVVKWQQVDAQGNITLVAC